VCVCVCVCAPPCQIDHTGFETPHSAQLEIWDCFPASIYAELNCTSASVNSIEYTTWKTRWHALRMPTSRCY